MRFFVLGLTLCIASAVEMAASHADGQEASLQRQLQQANAAIEQLAQMRIGQTAFQQEAAAYRSGVLQILPDEVHVLSLPGGRIVVRYRSQNKEAESAGWVLGLNRSRREIITGYSEITANGKLNPYVPVVFAPPLNRRIASINGVLGWRVGEEEAIAFLTAVDYSAYRRALGNSQQNALMWGRGWLAAAQDKAGMGGMRPRDLDSKGVFRPDPFQPRSFATGDTLGRQILAVSSEVVSNRTPGAAAETVTTKAGLLIRGSTRPPELGRMHGQVLVNALAAGGTPVPLWLQWGVAVISAQAMERANGFPEGTRYYLENTSAEAAAILRQQGALGPKKWSELVAGLGSEPYPHFRVLRIEAQAQRMVRFFYSRFGSGAVVETLQRLGSGQSVDEALFATTGLGEEQFFAAWQAAEQG